MMMLEKYVAGLNDLLKTKDLSNGKDYFIHFSAVGGNGFKTLTKGACVLFKMEQGQKCFQTSEVETVG